MARPRQASSKASASPKSTAPKKPTEDKNAIYKALTKYLVTGDEKLLEFICKDKKQAESLRNRVISYYLSSPKFLWYVNKYMNHKFDHSKWTNEEWFRMFAELTKLYGITDTNQLYFARYKANDYGTFAKTVRDYFETLDMQPPSSGEIQALFVLYKNGQFTEDDMDDMRLVISGQEVKRTPKQAAAAPMPGFALPPVQDNEGTKNHDFTHLAPKIQELAHQVTDYIRKRPGCAGCELRGRPSVILDTNLQEPGPVDIVFIALNPGNEEVKKGIPLIGPAGQIFRETFDKLLKAFNFTYLLTNVILCSTPNEASIKNPTKVAKQCAEIVNLIRQQFPAKLTVVMGDKAMKAAGVGGTVSKNNGTFIDGHFVCIHPSALQYGNKQREKFDFAMGELAKLISGVKKEVDQPVNLNVQIQDGSLRIPPDRIIKRIDSSLTLFDIRTFGEQVVFFFKDPNGVKKYYFEDINVPVYLRGGNYSNCPFITSDVNQQLILTNEQKDKLARKLNYDMNSLTGY